MFKYLLLIQVATLNLWYIYLLCLVILFQSVNKLLRYFRYSYNLFCFRYSPHLHFFHFLCLLTYLPRRCWDFLFLLIHLHFFCITLLQYFLTLIVLLVKVRRQDIIFTARLPFLVSNLYSFRIHAMWYTVNGEHGTWDRT